MALPSGFLRRYRAFLAAAAADQGLPEDELDRFFIDYPESVLMFLVVSREEGGTQGFADAFRLIDLIEALGGTVLVVDEPERWDPVVLGVRRGDGVLRDVNLTRAACNLARPRLLQVLREELEIERPTDQAIQMRARAVEAETRLLQKFGDRNLPADPNAPTQYSHDAPMGGAEVDSDERKRITQSILKQRPPGAGPDDDDGRSEPDPLAGVGWGEILQRVATAAAGASCKQVQIAKVGKSGIVKLEATGPRGAKIQLHIAPAIIAEPERLSDVIHEKVATAVRAVENLRATVVPEPEEEPEAASGDDGDAPPPLEFGSDEVSASTRLQLRVEALGYTDIEISPVGGGRYLKCEATGEDGLRLTVAMAVRSMGILDDDALESRVVLLFDQARADLA